MSDYVNKPDTLEKIKWVQPRYQVYRRHILRSEELSVDIHDLGFRKDFDFDHDGNSYISEINKNTYRIYLAFRAPHYAVYEEDSDIEDADYDIDCYDIKLQEPILAYICKTEPGFSGDILIAETKNYFIECVSMKTLSKKNLNIQRHFSMIRDSEFIILRGNKHEKNVNLKPFPHRHTTKLKSNFPTKEQWINVLRKALKSGNTSEANIKKIAGNLCIPLGDREYWYKKYLDLDITRYSKLDKISKFILKLIL